MKSSALRASLRIILLFVVIIACLGAAGVLWLASYLPRQAAEAFGSPSGALSAGQRLLLSLQLVRREKALLAPLDLQGQPQTFVIELGESTYQITNRLERQGLVADAELLRAFLVYSGLDTSVQAGEYSLSPGMSPVEIARALQDATPHEVDFRILPGWRLEEVAAALPTSGLSFSPQAFLDYAQRPPLSLPASAEPPAGASLEGFLFPQTYRLRRDAGVQQLAEAALQGFQANVGKDVLDGFAAQGLTVFEAVTLASLVQREAVVAEEMPLIASVFLNRLATGMRMDSDPTVQYALGYFAAKQTWWKNPLSLDDLQVNSPYNTYHVYGLPPGPIAAPSLNALHAVAFPAQSPYFFFRAACDQSGRHTFAETFEQHQSNACP
jgi:UPF0755 protein